MQYSQYASSVILCLKFYKSYIFSLNFAIFSQHASSVTLCLKFPKQVIYSLLKLCCGVTFHRLYWQLLLRMFFSFYMSTISFCVTLNISILQFLSPKNLKSNWFAQKHLFFVLYIQKKVIKIFMMFYSCLLGFSRQYFCRWMVK